MERRLRLRIPASRARSSSASPGASLVRLSRTTHARWPSSLVGGEVGLAAEGCRRRIGVALRQRAIRPGEGLLDVGLRVAHQLVEEPERGRNEVRIAAGAPVAVGHRRDRGRDETPLPARRGVHELFELRPAVGLGGDPDAVGVGEVVDGDPVARLTRRPSEELPGAFRVGGEGPLEQPEGEPACLEVGFAEQPIRDEQQLGGPLATGRVPEPATHGGQERPPDAVDGPIPGAT